MFFAELHHGSDKLVFAEIQVGMLFTVFVIPLMCSATKGSPPNDFFANFSASASIAGTSFHTSASLTVRCNFSSLFRQSSMLCMLVSNSVRTALVGALNLFLQLCKQ